MLQESEHKLSEKNEETANFIKQNPSFPITNENKEMVIKLWEDKSIQKLWSNSKNSMHNAHLDYFLTNIERIASAEYDPINEDIVRCRQYTIGASSTVFYFNKLWWRLIDVGGQIPERLKWKSIVEENNITGLIYFVALDEFDIASTEEKGKTKLELSLKIWGEVCGSGDFGDGQCNLLLFNKTDVFQEAIGNKKKYKAFKKSYPEYEGDQDPEDIQNFIKDKFIDTAKASGLDTRIIFTNFTCALDTEKMTFAWKSVFEWILMRRSVRQGFVL